MKVTQPHQPQPSTAHRDDAPALPPLPRPGCRVTPRALATARSTLRTAETQLARTRGVRRWRNTLRADSARAALRAGGVV